MSNRLEREFPAHRWQAVPPIRRDGRSHEVIQRYLARGHELRSEALRRTGRHVFAAVARGLGQVVTFLHCAAYGIVRRPPEHGCRCAAPRRA